MYDIDTPDLGRIKIWRPAEHTRQLMAIGISGDRLGFSEMIHLVVILEEFWQMGHES